ncbi:SpoIIE family protein phosphatase [Yinghuangia aomiensis]
MIARDNAVLEHGLRPRPAPHGDGFATAFHYAPGRSHALLGGDFCDVVQTGDGTVHAVMGDVSGHGAAEAALGVHLRLAWRAAVLCEAGPDGPIAPAPVIPVEERPKEETFATVLSLVLRPHLGSFPDDQRRPPRPSAPASPRTVRWVDPQPGIPLGLHTHTHTHAHAIPGPRTGARARRPCPTRTAWCWSPTASTRAETACGRLR